MPRILQLPPTVVAKIAAGEVIERPASVVKELLENAIDAGGRRIEVDLEQGGTELIRVVDDGCGIEPDDLALAFASHATSKLRDANELFRISTLGFRGEALASIGGVAQARLQSRAAGREEGAEIACDGGNVSELRPWNGSPGTRVEVRHLFYEIPVRCRFLRTQATEVGHVCEAVTRLALAHPTLHLVLRHNGKLVYDVPATAGLFDRIRLFFGADVGDHLYELDAAAGPVRLTGYAADPACERGNAKLQYLFVNGRWVRDRSLAHALQEGYRGLLLSGRYAVAFLFLTVPPDAVDVNVHPTKAEVRFRDAQQLYHLVLGAIRERLRRANLVPRLQAPREQDRAATMTGTPVRTEYSVLSTQYPVPGSESFTSSAPDAEAAATPTGGWELTASAPPQPGLEFPKVPAAAPAAPPASMPIPDGARAIQLHDAYLVVETDEGMLVIDQHALHERILFEQLRRRVQTGELETQRLLIPEPVDLTAEQAARVLEAKDELAALGLSVEDFGGGTIAVGSYPAVLGRASAANIFRGVVDLLVSKDRPPMREQLLERVLATMACRAAVKAGDRLTAEEIATLLEQRELAENTHHCPHGRPTSLLFSRHELDRQFRRLG